MTILCFYPGLFRKCELIKLLWYKRQWSHRAQAIHLLGLCLSNLATWLPGLSSHVHRDDFDPMSVDVGEEDAGPPLDHINQLVDALPAALALPVCLVQEQRLQQLLPQPPAPQHRHGLLRKPRRTESEEEVKSNWVLVSGTSSSWLGAEIIQLVLTGQTTAACFCSIAAPNVPKIETAGIKSVFAATLFWLFLYSMLQY